MKAHSADSASDGKAMKGASRSLFQSLRVQLALWHGSILALTLILLAGFTYILLRQVLNTRADSDLEQYASVTAKDIASSLYKFETLHPNQKLTELERQFIDNSELQSWGRFVQVVDTKGIVVARSDALKSRSFTDNPDTRLRLLSGQEQVHFDTETDLGQFPVRVVTVPVQMGARTPPYLVQVGASVEGVEEAIQRVSTLLLVLTPSIFLVALLGGWTLVGRSLKPVDEMTKAALSIESKRLDVRLVPPRTDNEIGRLASALNEMIARLDKSFRQVERFTADASHELKTPLTTIRGEAEVALMSDLTPEEHRVTLRSILEETERLSEIVNNLLLLSRADADQVRLKQEPVALHEVAIQAYEPMERLARRKNITLDIREMDEIIINGDALWLQQLITNLIHNAINYTPEGGSVLLSLTTESETTAILTVSDTGHGIPAEHLSHIFDRFYRVDSGRSRDQGGSGLGLNIVKWVAESHGGEILVASELNVGTTFTVRLPI